MASQTRSSKPDASKSKHSNQVEERVLHSRIPGGAGGLLNPSFLASANSLANKMLELSRASHSVSQAWPPPFYGQGPLCPLLHHAGAVLLNDLILPEEEDEDSLLEVEYKTQDI